MKEKETDIKISFYENVTAKNNVPVLLSEVLAMIKDGHCQGTIEGIREAKNIGFKKLMDERKKKLPAFTPSGLFNNGHGKDDIKTYSSVVVLDIDKIGSKRAEELKRKASAINTTLAAFISPSGEGLKILVQTDSTKVHHEQSFQQVSEFYEKELGVEVDKSGKDYSRLCFLSYDPELYYNVDCETVTVQSAAESHEFTTVSTTLDDALFENVVSFTEKAQAYYPDNRNNHIYLLANNLNRIGISKEETETKIIAKYPELKANNEIKNSVKSAYSHTAEHGLFTPEYINSVSSVSSASVASPKPECKTSLIPEEVYDNLPAFLKKGTDAFDIPRERDVFLTGAITILSGCFDTVTGIYDRREFHPNLNSFIIAPAASGKGVLNSSRDLAKHIHDVIEKAYHDEIAAGGSNLSSMPRTHFIPADASAAAFKLNLKMNQEVGTVCETEADTLSNTLQMEWGSYSDLIRKAFQHEPISYSRLGKGEDIKIGQIKRPKLSMCLTGTPNQVPNLLQSTEDGLFSRIIFYSYRIDGVPSFKDVFAESRIRDLTEYFDNLSKELYRLYSEAKKMEKVKFHLQDKQRERFVSVFDKLVKRVHFQTGEETRSIVFRLGLITFRIAMLLTILRSLEKGKFSNDISCEEVDFNSSLMMSEVYLEHALEVYQSLPGSIKINRNAEVFYAFLPKSFKYADAVKIGKSIAGISEKSISNYLMELKQVGLLKQPKKYGMYYK